MEVKTESCDLSLNDNRIIESETRIKNEKGLMKPYDDNFLREWAETEERVIKQESKPIAEAQVKNLAVDSELSESEDPAHDVSSFNEESHETNTYGKKDDRVSRFSLIALAKKIDIKRHRKSSRELDELIKSLCKDAVITGEVRSLCRFTCPKCGHEMGSWKLVRKHFGKESSCKHILSLTDVVELISTIVCHVCKLCSEKVLCDGEFIQRHLLARHKMQVRNYTEKFGFDTSKPMVEITYSNKVIGNFCIYQCDDCNAQFNLFHLLLRHQRDLSHKRSYKTKDNIIEKVYHQCQLCQKVLLSEKTIVRNHLYTFHRVSLKEYYKKTGCVEVAKKAHVFAKLITRLQITNCIANKCSFSCSACNSIFESAYDLIIHRRKERHIRDSGQPLITCLVKGFAYKCEICSSLMLCDRDVIRKHMYKAHKQLMDTKQNYEKELQYQKICKSFMENIPKSSIVTETKILHVSKIPIGEISSAIGNLCRFACKYCEVQNVYSSWYQLGKHCQNIHKKFPTYSSSIVLTARYHACLICQKAVLSDRFILREHLSRQHKKSLSSYEKIFCKHGGKTLPTFNKWKRSQ